MAVGQVTPEMEVLPITSMTRHEKDKDKSLLNGKIAVCFDIQQVLTVLRLFSGKSYYKRKLNMYNVMFYDLQSHNGTCFIGTEAEPNRGADDIATSVVIFLSTMDGNDEYDHSV